MMPILHCKAGKVQEYVKQQIEFFDRPTSGAERAAFWNGTGEYSMGTSEAVKKVKKDLKKITKRKSDTNENRRMYPVNFIFTI